MHALIESGKRAALVGFGTLPLVLAPVTCGLAFVAFRRPRSVYTRLRRAPGVIATLIAAALVGLSLLAEATARWSPGVSARIALAPIAHVAARMGEHVGIGILALWVVMALGGAWRPRPHLFDRLGRWLGGGWLLYLAWRGTAYWFFLRQG